MTNKQFFIETIEAEERVFSKALKAIPGDKLDFKPHEKARTAGRIAFQLACQPVFISGIATEGVPVWGDYSDLKNPNVEEMLALMEKNFAQLKKDLVSVSDEDWENSMAKIEWPGGEWVTKKYQMAWGFLFDAIHHRGQLTTYLRTMGARVPSVYFGSADEQMSSM